MEEQLSKGNNVILEIEIQGARNIKKIYPDSLLLFVTPPSAAELERRLKGRGTETDDVIAGRLSRAAEESLGIDDYDYIVVNDDLDTCVKTVDALVEAARSQPIRMKELIGQLREELEAYRK